MAKEKKDTKRMTRLQAHWILGRYFALKGIAVPFILGLAYAYYLGLLDTSDALHVGLMFVSIFALLIGTHYHNAYSDFVKGMDTESSGKDYTAGSSILPNGQATPFEVIGGAIFMYAIGLGSALHLYSSLGLHAFIPPILGLVCGVAYNEKTKYIGLGEPTLFISFGVVCTTAGFSAATGFIDWNIILISFIPGIQWTLFYTLDQATDMREDYLWGLRNLASYLAVEAYFPLSRYVESGFFSAVVWHLYLIVIGILPHQSFLGVLAFPFMFLTLIHADVKAELAANYSRYAFGTYVLLMSAGIILSRVV
jgi:1,4-dihydroxy-2-naphthoate octaprenyltransferase|tara:strand:- start:1685 stop:2611 length:927 start_codon:yes stop_codon:yes gene_type:complete